MSLTDVRAPEPAPLHTWLARPGPFGTPPPRPAALALPVADVPVGAIAVEVDALFDGVELMCCSVAEAVDSYGYRTRSWPDTGCVQPAFSLGDLMQARLRSRSVRLARRLGVPGAVRLRFAVHGDTLTPVSVEPGAAAGLACAATMTGLPLAEAAMCLAAGQSIERLCRKGMLPHTAPADADVSTAVRIGGATGVADTVPRAYALACAIAGDPLPERGAVLVSLHGNELRDAMLPLRRLADLGFRLLADEEHATTLRRSGIDCAPPDARPVALHARSATGTALMVSAIETTIETAGATATDDFPATRDRPRH